MLGVVRCSMDYSQRLNFLMKHQNHEHDFYVFFIERWNCFLSAEFVDFLAIFIAYLHKPTEIVCMRNEIRMKNTKYKPVRTLN